MMQILGLGTDIVEKARMAKLWQRFSLALPKRLLAEAEWPFFEQSQDQASFLAKRFAAKEAAAKALGSGFAQGVTPRDFYILKNQYGAPQLHLQALAAQRAKQLGVQATFLSLADEKHYAVATVIFSGVAASH